MLWCQFNLAGITRSLASKTQLVQRQPASAGVTTEWHRNVLGKTLPARNSAEQWVDKAQLFHHADHPGWYSIVLHTLYVPFLHISSLSRTLFSIASAPLAVRDHFFVPFAHPLFPLIPGNSPSNHGRSLPPLSSDLLRAPPVVLHQPSTHHPGLPQPHLAFYCTNCCSRLNTYLFFFIWVWKREK